MAQALDKAGFELRLVCPEDGGLPQLARQAGLEVKIVSRPKFSSVSFLWKGRYVANPFGFLWTALNVFGAMVKLERALRGCPADIIITKGLLAHFYGGWAAKGLGIPCIWYVQEEVDARRGGGFYRSILKWGAQNIPDKILVDATALLEQFGQPHKTQAVIRVVYNGIDTQQFVPFTEPDKRQARDNLNIPLEAIVLGQTGRIIPLKGQITLLEAFACLVQDFPDIHLLFVGAPLFASQDYERNLHLLATQWGLEDRVHFSGFVADVRQGLAAMDIFIHASIETDSPVSVQEAMACGLPVVVSGVRGTVEMVEPGDNGLIFEAGNSKALAATLRKLLQSPQSMRYHLGQRARATVVERFSLEASTTQLQQILEEVHAA